MNHQVHRRFLFRALAGLCFSPRAFASNGEVSVKVLGLLHPRLIILAPSGNNRLRVIAAGQSQILEGQETVRIAAHMAPLEVSAAGGGPTDFALSIPGVIRRHYFGTLTIAATGQILNPVISMPLEIAVSSIAGAELPVSSAPIASLSAQAVVARSFLTGAGKRHPDADFCDTTHCQFLRSPALPGSKTGQAVYKTAGLILTSEGRALAARYSAACGGFTEAANQAEAANNAGYLYQHVACEVCQRLGTPRRGHGFGLCQEGAMQLAQAGWSWQRIISKYYPGAAVEALSRRGA
jgi:peptidoglycan hydrolase-like amidase